MQPYIPNVHWRPSLKPLFRTSIYLFKGPEVIDANNLQVNNAWAGDTRHVISPQSIHYHPHSPAQEPEDSGSAPSTPSCATPSSAGLVAKRSMSFGTTPTQTPSSVKGAVPWIPTEPLLIETKLFCTHSIISDVYSPDMGATYCLI